MPTRFNLPHVDIARRQITRPYQAPRENRGGGSAPRIREEHGARLQAELAATFREADVARPDDERLEPPEGVYLEVELRRGAKADELERKRAGSTPGAVKLEENEMETVALYVPDEARPVFEQILEDYRAGALTPAGEPQRKSFVEAIEAIRRARLETFWTDDPDALPEGPHEVIWWEVWCFKGTEAKLDGIVETLGARAADRENRLYFPEVTAIPVLTDRITIELMLFATFAISELRRASASPVFFTDAEREDQYGWAENLAERTVWPGADAPAVCLLDTGVNRAHILLEPALSPGDMTAIYPDWGVADDPDGHGTGMAGLALHGDLTPLLQDEAERQLAHRLESVKILPPRGFPRTDPSSYGSITQAAVARTEIARPERSRVFCMAVTNDNVSGSRSTTWSAAIDQVAAAVMPGDDEESPRRLFIVSSGNAPAHIERDRILAADEYPVEDPAQAWNALTVGGYTDKIHIQEANLDGWTPFAQAGDLSPFTRTSVTWPQGKVPFKPEIVMEAGNRAVSPNGRDVLTVDSLGVLSTGVDTDRQPLTPFQATSAAAAQAAHLAARLSAAHPEYWPETIRALIIHSAEWTAVMKDRLAVAPGRRESYALLRRFGYGVPSFERAAASAQNHLALVAQSTIRPFKNENGRKFRDCHFYPLPWPRDVLEGLEERDIRLKITLSYFVDPNPGRSASIDPQHYQSFGLRFDLRRRLEPVSDFVERVNALERDDPLGRARVIADDNRWRFGPQSMSCGSLHCDEWTGPAVELAARDIICIKPVIGWWRNRASLDFCNKQARYSLVVTLSTPDVAVDLHTPISTIVETDIGVEIRF